MSKAELFKQFETLNPAELEEAAMRIEELRQIAEPVEELTETERRILDERTARAAANPGQGEPWPVVRDRVRAEIRARKLE